MDEKGINNILQSETVCGCRQQDEQGILRISSSELDSLLKYYHALFWAVRILDSDCLSYCLANQDGSLQEKRRPCYELWKSGKRCENCISMQSLKGKKTEHKFEVAEKDIYIVFSVYLEVDGEAKVIELLNPVGRDILHGFRKDPTLIDVIQGENSELYQDSMLKIYNRRFFDERIEKLENISALAMIDIDNFKNVNDTYGHSTGDQVLKAVVSAIKGDIRTNDYLIRMGGDEFMIGFTGMKEQFLYYKLEDIRKMVENNVSLENPHTRVTISVGGTVCRGYSDQAREKADQALYEGKRQKNMVVVK